MAVVFISPKQRQKMFFTIITVIFLLFLIVIFLGVFLSKPKEVLPILIFNKTKIIVNTNIFDSDQFKNLQPFMQMEKQYSYKATTKNEQLKEGFISATSSEQAEILLEDMGLDVSEIKELQIGRENPFVPYYQAIVKPKL